MRRANNKGRLRAALLLVGLLGIGIAAPLRAEECSGGAADHATMENLAAGAAPALFTRPQGWHGGCAAVVLAWLGTEPLAPYRQLVSALLDQGVAVLEVDASTPFGMAADNGITPARGEAGPAAIAQHLVAAAQALRQLGAEPLAALGFGHGGEAALLALEAGAFPAAGSLGVDGAFRFSGIALPAAACGWAARICYSVSQASRVSSDCNARRLADRGGQR